VRVRRREICANGSANAARAGFGTPVTVKRPLCQPMSLGSSLKRNQISSVAPAVARRSALTDEQRLPRPRDAPRPVRRVRLVRVLGEPQRRARAPESRDEPSDLPQPRHAQRLAVPARIVKRRLVPTPRERVRCVGVESRRRDLPPDKREAHHLHAEGVERVEAALERARVRARPPAKPRVVLDPEPSDGVAAAAWLANRNAAVAANAAVIRRRLTAGTPRIPDPRV
jgi:hypothetical protein